MDDLSLVRAARTKTTGPTDAATAAARAKLAARMERPTRFSFRPRFSPLVISLSTVAAVAVIATVAFTAFGMGVKGLHDPAIAPTPTATPTPTPTPSPTSTPIAVVDAAMDSAAWTSPPVAAFGGDCNSVFSLEQVAGFLGVPSVELIEFDDWGDITNPTRAIIPHNGGLWCMWDDGVKDDGTMVGDHPWLIATIVPASALPGSFSGITCVPNNQCTFMTGADGYLLGGTIGLNGAIGGTRLDLETVSDAAYEGINEEFPVSTARAGTPPASYVSRPGDWATNLDCESLFSDAGVWDALDRKPAEIWPPDDDNWPSQMDDLIATGHGLTTCNIGDYGNVVSVNVLPGGAWTEDAIAKKDGVQPTSVTGADRAYFATFDGEEGSSATLWAIDGPNLLVVAASDRDDAKAPAAALLRSLDDGGVPDVGIITTAGYGDLKLGKPVPSSTTLVKWVTVDPDECFDKTGYWALAGIDGNILVRTVDGTRDGDITAISVWDTEAIQTKSGAHVGMSLTDLKALFPTADVKEHGALHVVKDNLGQVVFDVDGEKVVLIHVILTTTKPFTAQNMGFGPCI
jgi:hypothetical protein